MKILAEELVERADRVPHSVAVVDAEGQHSVEEVVVSARELASALGSICDGAPTVIVRADNTWRTMASAIAIGMCGGVIAVMSRHASAAEFSIALEDVAPDAVVGPEETFDQWRLDRTLFAATTSVLNGWTVAARRGRTAGVNRWDEGVAIALTSGSTGRPKAVVQSEAALRYAASVTIAAVGLRPADSVAALVPLSSVAAFCFGLYLPAMLNGPQVCLDHWSPEAAIELMADHEVRWTMLVPTMALQLSLVPGSDGRLSSLKAVTVGGGPMNAASLRRAELALGTVFLRVFGMSECLGHTTSRPLDDPATRLEADGRPFPGIEHRIVGDDGKPLPMEAVGHVQVRGPSMFVGYAREGRPQPPPLTADGYFATGDIGRLSDDRTIHIVGRDKQIIIRGGRNIDINEVEAALAALPEVAQVCVVPVPDPMLGERAAALVVATSPLTLEDVRQRLSASEFPKAKWPEYVYLVPELPQNRVGKLSRDEAVKLAARLAVLEESQRERSETKEGP